MVEDHGKANDELKSIATSKKMGMPAAPDASQQKAAAALEAKSGADFDRAFKQQMIADHKSAIALFQKEAKSGSDPDLKSFAGKTLPTLQEHLKMAEAMK
jgi:putative membrane protein